MEGEQTNIPFEMSERSARTTSAHLGYFGHDAADRAHLKWDVLKTMLRITLIPNGTFRAFKKNDYDKVLFVLLKTFSLIYILKSKQMLT